MGRKTIWLNTKGKSWWKEDDEKVLKIYQPDAIIKNLKEIIPIIKSKVKKLSFIGIVENIYKENGERHHEINLVFSVLADKIKDKSLEDHIDFFFLDKKRFKREKVLPISLEKNIIKWLKDKKIFWASQIEKKLIE